jgi:hypothetical protein
MEMPYAQMRSIYYHPATRRRNTPHVSPPCTVTAARTVPTHAVFSPASIVREARTKAIELPLLS